MSQTTERSSRAITRPTPDEAMLEEPHSPSRRSGSLRVLGALAVLVVGAVHLEQYFAVHINHVHVIGALFLLNFIGATVIGIGLLIPSVRLHPLQLLLALAGIGIAATSFVFLFISEHQPLFGFHEHGYRTEIIIALTAEAAAVLSLSGYLIRQRHPD